MNRVLLNIHGWLIKIVHLTLGVLATVFVICAGYRYPSSQVVLLWYWSIAANQSVRLMLEGLYFNRTQNNCCSLQTLRNILRHILWIFIAKLCRFWWHYCTISQLFLVGLLKFCITDDVDVRMILICCDHCAIPTRMSSSYASVLCLQHLSTTLLRSGCRNYARVISRRPSFSLAHSQTFELISKFVVNHLLSFYHYCRHPMSVFLGPATRLFWKQLASIISVMGGKC